MIQNLDLDRALDDVEREFDNSISDMERQKIYSKPSSDHLNYYQQQQQQQPSNGMTGRIRGTNTPQSSSSMGIQRSSSATRDRESSSSLMSSRSDLMHGSSIHAPNGSNSSICTDQTQQDRKYELLVKKQRLFEEKLKKLDKDCLHSHQCSIDYKIELDRLTEESKADKKLVQSLRGQMAAVKSKMDLFMSNEELREKVTASLQSTDMTGLRELVQQTVQKELTRCIPEAVSSHLLKDQQQPHHLIPSSHNTNTTSASLSSSISGMNHLDNRMYLEKEFIRINSEFERLKLRQSTLEGTCSDLRSGASARESRVEEQHRKAIQQHRSELDAFIGSTGKKVFEAINVLRENNVTAMRADLDGFIDKCGYALAQFDMKYSTTQESNEAMQQEIRRIQQSQEYYQSQLNNALLSMERLQQDSSNEAIVSSHSKQLRVVDERLEMLTINISSLSSAIDTNAIPVDLLAKSIDDINEKFESRTNILKSQVDELTIHTQVRVDELTDGLKKSKTKVRDLSETMKKISQIKQSIESVLSEVDSRAKQDASWTYEFKAGLQKLELKYGALEEQFEPLLENYLNTQTFASRMEELSRSYHEVMESMGGLKKDLLEEVHVSNSLTSKQLKETMQIKVDMVREEVSTMHKQQSDRVDGRFQKISEVVNDNLGRIDETISDMQEHASRAKIASDKSIESIGSSLVKASTGVDELTRKIAVHDDVLSSCMARLHELHESNVARHSKEQLYDKSLASLQSGVVDVSSRFNDHTNSIYGVITGEVTKANDSTVAYVKRCLAELEQKHGSTIDQLQQSIVTSRAEVDDRSRAMVDALQHTTQQSIDDMGHTLARSIADVEQKTIATIDDVRTKLYEVVDILASHDVTSHRSMDETNEKLSGKHRMLRDDFSRFKEELSGQVALLNQAVITVDGKVEGYHADALDSACELHAASSHLKDLISAGQSSFQSYQQSNQEALSLLQNDITSKTSALESSLSLLDSFAKNKFVHVERRATAQEAAMKERVINLEIKVVDQEKLLQRRVAIVEEGLKDSVPLDYKTAREAEMEARLTQLGDLLLTQVAAMRERLDEVSDRVVATENECLTIAPAVQDKLSKSTIVVKEALNESIKSIRHDMNAMFKSKDDELYQMYEELCKLQRELSSHQSAVNQTTLDGIELSNLTRSRLVDLENSIIATDDLLTEQVNDIIARLEVLTTNYSHSAQITASHAVEEDEAMAKRLADMEHRIASNAATIKLRSSELEVMVNKNNAALQVCSNSYTGLSDQLMAIATEIVGVDSRLRAVEEMNEKQQEVNEKHKRSVDAAREQLRSHNEEVTQYINNNIADVKGSLMDLYNNTIACYLHIDDYSAWKDSIERVLTDYSYSIQSNADRIDSCDAVVNDVQSSYSDHQVYVEALVSAMRKDLDDLSSKHLQEQVQQKQQMEHESLRRLNEMVSDIQLIKPRLATLEQKRIRQEALLKEKLSDVVTDMQSQSRSMVEQGIDRWRAEVNGLIATRMSDYCRTSELDSRLLDLDRDREVIDSLSSHLKLLDERMSTQNGAMEDRMKAILARLDDDHDVLKRTRMQRLETGDASKSMKKGIPTMVNEMIIDHSGDTVDGGDDGGIGKLEEEIEGSPLSRFHTMISSINSDIATIEEHLDESRSLDPHRVLDDDDDNYDGESEGRHKSDIPSSSSTSDPLLEKKRQMEQAVQAKKNQQRRQLQSSLDKSSSRPSL